MAWYKSGTVSVDNGGTVVTGVGTFWLNAIFPGDSFTLDGEKLYEIASVDDNEHHTLAEPYGEVMALDVEYSIVPTSPLRNSVTALVAQFSKLVDDYKNVILIANQDRVVSLNKAADAANAGVQLLSNNFYKFRLGIFGSNQFAISYSPDGTNLNWVDVLAIDTDTGAAHGQFLMGTTQVVISRNTTVPPSLPDVGDQYYVPVGAVGPWEDLEGKIVRWTGTSWAPYDPVEGQIIFDSTADSYFSYQGGVFIPMSETYGLLPPQSGGTGVANDPASTITINGAYSLALTLSANTSLTLPASGVVTTDAGVTTLTNKSIDGANNTITNLTTAAFAGAAFSTDPTLGDNSDTIIASQKAIKSYIDNAVYGLSWKDPVAVVATTNLDLNGEETIDGVTTNNSRVAVTGQTDPKENGLYNTSTGAWTRTEDANSGNELAWASFLVEGGTLNAGTIWSVSNDSIVIGVTNISIVKIQGVGITYVAGAGLTLTGGTTFSITTNGVVYSMLQQVTGSKLLGNPTGSTANVSEIGITTNLEFNGSDLRVIAAPTFSGVVTGAAFVPTGSSVPTNGMYLSASNTVAFAANSTNIFTYTTNGLIVGAPTGSYKGAGTINATGLYVNGVAVLTDPGIYVYSKVSYTATAGQTTFSASYTVGYVDVWRSGIKLNSSQYAASNGTSIVLADGANEDDVIEIIGYTTINISTSSFGLAVTFSNTATFADGGTWSSTGIAGLTSLVVTNAIGLGTSSMQTWNSSRVAVQLGYSGAVFGYSSADGVDLASNMWWANPAYKYIHNGMVARYSLGSGIHIWQTAGTGSANADITLYERMRLDNDGDLLIGTTSKVGPYSTFSKNQADYVLRLQNSHTNAYVLRLLSNATAGTTYTIIAATKAANVTNFVVYSNGNVQNTNNSYGGISDRKLKEDIELAGSQWEDIKALSLLVSKYTLKSTGVRHLGLIAQDVQLISPGLVYSTPDREDGPDGALTGEVTLGINYSILYMKAVKALGEALIRIEALETQVNNG